MFVGLRSRFLGHFVTRGKSLREVLVSRVWLQLVCLNRMFYLKAISFKLLSSDLFSPLFFLSRCQTTLLYLPGRIALSKQSQLMEFMYNIINVYFPLSVQQSVPRQQRSLSRHPFLLSLRLVFLQIEVTSSCSRSSHAAAELLDYPVHRFHWRCHAWSFNSTWQHHPNHIIYHSHHQINLPIRKCRCRVA